MRHVTVVLAAFAVLVALSTAEPASAEIELFNAKTDKPLKLRHRKTQEITPEVTAFLATGENAHAGVQASIEEGGALYKKRCAACHAADGSGKVGPSLVDDEWLYERTPTAVGQFEIIYDGGRSSMRGFGRQLDQDDILKVMAFVDALAAGDVQVEAAAAASGGSDDRSVPPVPFTDEFLTASANLSAGETFWAAQCRHCHGAKAYPGKAPKLKPATYEPDFVYRRITDGFRKMPAWKDEYSDEERMQITAYIMSDVFSP